MYSAPPGDDVAAWISRVTGIVNVCMIAAISVFVVVDVLSTSDIDLVQDETAIPRWVYLALLVVLMVSSFLWMMSEWFMDRWKRYKAVYNLGTIYIVMIVTTFVLLLFHLVSGRALFDFLPMVLIFFVPFGFIYAAWAYTTTPQMRSYAERIYARWTRRAPAHLS
jgi:hypothetical protein